jgi:NAD(P)H-dependent FMN reductase
MTQHVLFLVGSAREPGHVGNTEWLARVAAEALPATAMQTWLPLAQMQIPPFVDLRHTEGAYPMPVAGSDLRRALDATMTASEIVLVSPVYWYAPPTAIKAYIDHWSAWMRVPGLGFKEAMALKTLSTVVTNGSRETAEPTIKSYELCAKFLAMRWRGALWGKGGPPDAVHADAKAIEQAKTFLGAAA